MIYRQKTFFRYLLVFLAIISGSHLSIAYVGPGAGFAFISSFFVIFLTFLLVFFSLMTYPVRYIYKSIKKRKIIKNSKTRRAVVIGFDGMDPVLTKKYMDEGFLPNLKILSENYTFQELQTTRPAISPVAWSSFQTGCNPGKHNIFDFLSRDKNTYLPDLSSTHIEESKKSIRIGKYNIPLGKPRIELLRKSIPFWKTLGEYGINNISLRVPITFPPEKYRGICLSAMCVPDILGTQGTFTFYTSEKDDKRSIDEGGQIINVTVENNKVKSYVKGPDNSIKDDEDFAKAEFTVDIINDQRARLIIDKQEYELKIGEYTEWIELAFKMAPMVTARGIARFLLKSIKPEFRLYITPINIDPENPAMPISHPLIYSVYLAKKYGKYATLGLAEDTWALSEGIINDDEFIKQTYDIHEERELMLFDSLEKIKEGLVVCVFDTTDRMQHMFFRYLDDSHPANLNLNEDIGNKRDIIKDLYIRMDQVVGRAMKEIRDDEYLFIMSDHGFKQFQRGINLNAWLKHEGLLSMNDNVDSGEWYRGVDWSKTKAYGFGLGGMYLNIKNREKQGILEGEDIDTIINRIIEGLESLIDPKTNERCINKVYRKSEIFHGPYLGNAPDLIVGYRDGYRASWDSVKGKVSDEIFEDNTNLWSGDHSINPEDVPGILFINKKTEQQEFSIIDIAPTILSLFGIDKPGHIDGKVIKFEH